jgi:hypothetical protein
MSETNGAEDMRDYEVTSTKGVKMRFRIPASYRITFGPLAIASKGGGPYNQQLVLRVYEDAAKEKQRMLLTDVAEFRDLSIPILVEAARRPGDHEWFAADNPNGPIVNYTGDRSKIEWAFVPESDVIGLQPKRVLDVEEMNDAPHPERFPYLGSKKA